MEEQPRSRTPWLRGLLVVIAAVAVGWILGNRLGGDPENDHADEVLNASSQVYRDVAGRVVRLAPEDGVITVDHEAIEGFMAAMVMDLQLADPAEATRFEPGDDILFDLAYIGGTFQAVRLRPADGSTNQNSEQTTPENPLGRGDLVPDIELYGIDGERFPLREMEPRHKVVTFFYVRCPMEDFCPAQSQRLAQLQRQTAESPSGVHLVSLTLDADFDSPEILADYAERFGADPDRWTLAGSDDAEAIREFANRAGARITQHESGYDIDHALIGLRVDGDRIVDLVYGLEAIEELVRAM